MDEAAARAEWLAKQQQPSWGQGAASAGAAAGIDEVAGETMAGLLDALSGLPVEQAQAAWLAQQNAPPPEWYAPTVKGFLQRCEQGNEEACATLSHEEAAKRAWLQKDEVALGWHEEDAKRAWLQRRQAPSWQGRVNPAPPAAPASGKTATVLAEGERLLQGAGLSLSTEERDAVRKAMDLLKSTNSWREGW